MASLKPGMQDQEAEITICAVMRRSILVGGERAFHPESEVLVEAPHSVVGLQGSPLAEMSTQRWDVLMRF
jgi:hypothetical protein